MSSLVRLNSALDWIDIDDKLADIGCDHGYLADLAFKKGVSFVQLIDNKEGPLNVAKKNLYELVLNDEETALVLTACKLAVAEEEKNGRFLVVERILRNILRIMVVP